MTDDKLIQAMLDAYWQPKRILSRSRMGLALAVARPIIERETLEKAAKACEAEHLIDPNTESEGDEAYDLGVRHCAAALRSKLEMAKEALKETLPALAAAISLLSRSPKKAAPSDTMFDIMLEDYKKALDAGRAIFTELPADAPSQRDGIFRDHSCWKCKDGKEPCVVGNPSRCEYPHARND